MLLALVAAALVSTAAPATASTSTSAPAHAAAAKTHGSASASAWKPVVPFVEDDFGRALALAKARKLPVFIEGWAPW